MNADLLTRDQFRAAVFDRDGRRCVLCGSPGVDAHHIVERRLFADGGYYLDNGATVCGQCHIRCEQTLVSCEELRERCGIPRAVIPEHLYSDQRIDKWGNPILDNGQRLRGELFEDESARRVLAPVLGEFTNRVKYPRTYHLPWSPGATSDDRIASDADSMFAGREVVITEKMDGENCTLYRDGLHARSLEYSPHPSRDRVKALWASIAHEIPDGWRICGENLTAEHSIHYGRLRSFFQVFSVWDDRNACLSWTETEEWAALLGLATVPVLAVAALFGNVRLAIESLSGADPGREGYVVRLSGEFHYREFRSCVAKWVRPGHVVHRAGHWANRPVVFNEWATP